MPQAPRRSRMHRHPAWTARDTSKVQNLAVQRLLRKICVHLRPAPCIVKLVRHDRVITCRSPSTFKDQALQRPSHLAPEPPLLYSLGSSSSECSGDELPWLRELQCTALHGTGSEQGLRAGHHCRSYFRNSSSSSSSSDELALRLKPQQQAHARTTCREVPCLASPVASSSPSLSAGPRRASERRAESTERPKKAERAAAYPSRSSGTGLGPPRRRHRSLTAL